MEDPRIGARGAVEKGGYELEQGRETISQMEDLNLLVRS